MSKCNIPPEGWQCSREAGHTGPCAAYAQPDEVARLKEDNERLKQDMNLCKQMLTQAEGYNAQIMQGNDTLRARIAEQNAELNRLKEHWQEVQHQQRARIAELESNSETK
jgi:chromosome segregation ATPase